MGGKRFDFYLFLNVQLPYYKATGSFGKDEGKINSVIFSIVEYHTFLARTWLSLHSRVSGSVNRLKSGNWLRDVIL